MKNKLAYGIKAEQKVANQLRRKGASVKVSPGSRGAADLVADFGSKKWNVQVKAGKTAPKNLTGTAKQRLTSSATKSGATPVLATVTNQSIEYRSMRSGKKLNP